MPELFGIDIAGLVNDAIAGAGGVLPATLHKRTPASRTAGSLTGGLNVTYVDHACRGFMERKTSQAMMEGALVIRSGERVSILGASLPAGVVPEAQDDVTIEGARYKVRGVRDRDPAAALYVLDVEL